MREIGTKTEQLLKPTATIHVGNRLSLIERKIFNAIIWHSQRNRFAKNANSVSIELLMSLIGLERSKNMDVIKDALEKLTTNPIIWNTLKKDRTADWGICTFLAGAELSGGRLRYVLNPLLVEKVNHPTLFAKIQLLVQTHFSSKYSLALYEFLLDELCRAGNPTAHTFQVTLDTVRHVLQFDGIYKHLNNDVLKPCVLEINKHSDIAVGYRGVKKGRAVADLLFTVERTAMHLQMPLDDLMMMAGEAQESSEATPSRELLTLVLIDKGVAESKARVLVETYDEARIRENLAHVEREHESGKVKSVSAYLIRAIEEDYRLNKARPEAQREQAVDTRTHEACHQTLDQLTNDWHRYRERRVRERFLALPLEEQEAHRAAFVERLRNTNPVIHRQHKKDGFASRMVEAQFFAELREQLLASPEELSFDAYRAQQSGTGAPVTLGNGSLIS
ncbi:MAG: replication initiation protein [Azonexus sp.]